MKGWTREEVIEACGRPAADDVVTDPKEFAAPIECGRGRIEMLAPDEEWSYEFREREFTRIYFREGRVVFAMRPQVYY